MFDAPAPLLTLIKRELLSGMRSWNGVYLLLALLSGMYAVTFIAMRQVADGNHLMAPAMRDLFQAQIFVLGFIAFAAVPAMAAASYNSERQDGNYDLLLTTLIPPHTIALGKYLAVLVRALLTGAAVLPFTALVYFYAGVDLGQFFEALAFIIPASLCNAAAGLWCSRMIPKPARAIFVAFGIVTAMALLVPAAVALYENVRLLRNFGPFTALANFASSAPVNSFLLYVAYQLLAALAFLLAAMFGLRRIRVPLISPPPGSGAPAESLRQRAARRFRAPFRPIPDGANPLGWKDLCGSATSSPTAARTAFGMVVASYIAFYIWICLEFPEGVVAIGAIERVLLVLFIPPHVAVLMVKEREDTTLDMLRMTLLGARSVITGKIAVLLRMLKPVLLAAVLCKFFILLASTIPEVVPTGPPGYFYWLEFLLMPLHFMLVVCTALLGATFFRNLVPAIACASGCVFAGTYLFLYLQIELLSGASSSELDSVIALLASHLLLALLAFVITVLGAVARLARLWSGRER